MAYFPMMIDLKDKPVLVIGAGEEGTKKVEVLYDFGCKIILVAKEATKAAIEKSTAFFNKHISELAGKNKIPVNVVDDTELCSFIFPAIIKDRDVVVSVSSGGKSPYVAQYIKAIVRDNMPKDIGLINDKMGEYRISAKQEISDVSERRKFLKAKLNDLLEGERK